MRQRHTRQRFIVMAKAILLGFGNVGRRCIELILRGVSPKMTIVGISDSKGGIFCDTGLDLAKLLEHKNLSGSVVKFTQGTTLSSSQELYDLSKQHNVDIVIDVSPVDLKTGGPALPILQDALSNGIHCVLANKAPLVLDYQNLSSLAKQNQASLSFSATVCGGLPVVNVGRRDLRGAQFQRISGIFNSTSNYVLAEMEQGKTVEQAISEAQEIGIAEADPSLDIDGYDTANKLVILTNAVMGHACTLEDVELIGVGNVTKKDIDAAKETGDTIRLVATTSRNESSGVVTMSVKPTKVSMTSFFGQCSNTSMCCRFETDIFETIELKTDEKGVYPTSAAVLRDCFEICDAR